MQQMLGMRAGTATIVIETLWGCVCSGLGDGEGGKAPFVLARRKAYPRWQTLVAEPQVWGAPGVRAKWPHFSVISRGIDTAGHAPAAAAV